MWVTYIEFGLVAPPRARGGVLQACCGDKPRILSTKLAEHIFFIEVFYSSVYVLNMPILFFQVL
jgi:hypothetical protein